MQRCRRDDALGSWPCEPSAAPPAAEPLRPATTSFEASGPRAVGSLAPSLVFVEVDAPHQDNFDLLPRLRAALESDGRIIAVCSRYAERLDDYCEALGANFALPQMRERAHFNLFVRGLISLIPPRRHRTRPALRAAG